MPRNDKFEEQIEEFVKIGKLKWTAGGLNLEVNSDLLDRKGIAALTTSFKSHGFTREKEAKTKKVFFHLPNWTQHSKPFRLTRCPNKQLEQLSWRVGDCQADNREAQLPPSIFAEQELNRSCQVINSEIVLAHQNAQRLNHLKQREYDLQMEQSAEMQQQQQQQQQQQTQRRMQRQWEQQRMEEQELRRKQQRLEMHVNWQQQQQQQQQQFLQLQQVERGGHLSLDANGMVIAVDGILAEDVVDGMMLGPLITPPKFPAMMQSPGGAPQQEAFPLRADADYDTAQLPPPTVTVQSPGRARPIVSKRQMCSTTFLTPQSVYANMEDVPQVLTDPIGELTPTLQHIFKHISKNTAAEVGPSTLDTSEDTMELVKETEQEIEKAYTAGTISPDTLHGLIMHAWNTCMPDDED